MCIYIWSDCESIHKDWSLFSRSQISGGRGRVESFHLQMVTDWMQTLRWQHIEQYKHRLRAAASFKFSHLGDLFGLAWWGRARNASPRRQSWRLRGRLAWVGLWLPSLGMWCVKSWLWWHFEWTWSLQSLVLFGAASWDAPSASQTTQRTSERQEASHETPRRTGMLTI